MARKPATRTEFTLFDVVYEDDSQRSNRRVPSEILGGLDGDAPARAFIEEQDRLIAEPVAGPAERFLRNVAPVGGGERVDLEDRRALFHISELRQGCLAARA